MMWLKLSVILASIAVAGLALWVSFFEPTRTVSYYMAHPDERAAELARGADNPAARGPNYEAAVEAKWKADNNSFLAAVRQHFGN